MEGFTLSAAGTSEIEFATGEEPRALIRSASFLE